MPVEFLGMGATNDGSETNRRTGGSFDPDFTTRLAKAHEENGWDRVLTAYGSGMPDPAQAAAWIAVHTESLQLLLAHRPNLSIPTFAAKTFATLDHISDGRLTIHFITGGSDHEQRREGDMLSHDERYSRTHEYIQIVKKVWSTTEPWDHDGTHYQFKDFVADVWPIQRYPQISFGGSSDAAYEVGTQEADIYCLWGEPLKDTAEQIERIEKMCAAAGKLRPKIQVAFRPILAPTEEKAWARAHEIVERIRTRQQKNPWIRGGSYTPQNTGSQRLMEIAKQGERYDRCMFTGTALATGGSGNSNALVGTPETVAAALLDYVDLGADILSARGYDSLQDTIDFGQQVIPIVREEVTRRDAVGANA